MQNVMVRIEIDPGVAVRHGGARAGRGMFQISEAQLAELTDAQREIVATCATVSTSTEWPNWQKSLALQGANSWESVKAAILATEERMAAERREEAEQREAAVQQLLTGPLHPFKLSDALWRACNNVLRNNAHLRATDVLLGRFKAYSDDERVSEWLEAVVPRAQAERAAELAAFAAQVQQKPESIEYLGDNTNCFGGVWGPYTAGELREALGAWWETYTAEKAARIHRLNEARRVASEAEAAAAELRRRRLLAWAEAQSPTIAGGIAEGYDQTSLAAELLGSTITDGLTDPKGTAAEFAEDDEIEPRTNVSAAALAALARVRERAEALNGKLPEGVTLKVGRISRHTYMAHGDDCEPCGDCGASCGTKKRTVVAVHVIGRSADEDLVVVPVE